MTLVQIMKPHHKLFLPKSKARYTANRLKTVGYDKLVGNSCRVSHQANFFTLGWMELKKN